MFDIPVYPQREIFRSSRRSMWCNAFRTWAVWDQLSVRSRTVPGKGVRAYGANFHEEISSIQFIR